MEELIGTPLYTYVTEENQQEVKGILEQVLETGETASYETSYSTPDGDTIYYESRVVSRGVEGKIAGLAVNARDITEHKRAEQALRDASEVAEQARQAEEERRREADQRRRVAESLAGVMAALNSNQPLDHVLDHIAAQARELLDNQVVAIYSLDQAGDELVLQAAQGSARADLQAIDRACSLQAIAQALASGQPLVVNDPATLSSQSESQVSTAFQALLAMPFFVQDEVFGGMVMCSTEPRSYSTEEVELASVFANQVALAVESARLRNQREQAAAAAERNRLARDLHDSVTQALFSAGLVAEVLPQVWERDPTLAREGLQELGILTRSALAEMRTMLLELRPTALVETRLNDLVWQLAEAVTSRAGLLVTYNVEPSPTLPPDVHVTFYRVAQEALHNVLKHAKAEHVTVSLLPSPPADAQATGDWQGQVTLAVGDDGQGFDPGDLQPDQLGLGIMRERAETIGAELGIESRPGRGTRVTLIWPREKTAAGV
jgi:signal transduction histidine kinase